jgi:tetratricopeptide (TPR) repeat protein
MLARGLAPLWLALVLALGLPAASRAQDASPDAEELPPAAPALDLAPTSDLTLSAVPPAPLPRLPGPVIDRIELAWSGGTRELGDRARRTRAAADETGVASVDSLARALVFGGADLGTPEQRAEAAVLLAPDLPAAHAALARARFASGSLGGAVASALDAIAALSRSLDGWLWLGASGWVLLLFALAGGALAYLGARGLASASHVAHDLGDRLEPSMPDFSRVALVAGLVLLPAALGEGVAGAALVLFALGSWQSSRAQQIALAGAALLLVAAIHPVAQIAGARLAAIGADPIVAAVVAAESGALDPVDAARLARAAPDPASRPAAESDDPLAMYALAQWARRSGDLAAADARFEALLARDGTDPVALASAASAKIASGDPKAAVELYRRAIASEPSALLWFNLSQAHGRAIDVEQHARALAAAQSLDADAVSELTARLAGSRGAYVADLPLPQQRLRERLAAPDARLAAELLRRPLAPGLLGRSSWIAVLAFAAAGALGVALRRRVEASRTCLDCGTRLCRHCGTARDVFRHGVVAEPRCESCEARRIEARAGAGWESGTSGARAWLTRGANALGWLLPGLVGRSARRPALGLGAALCAAGAVAFGLGADAVVPDPASVGFAGAIVFGVVTAFCVTLYAAIAGLVARLDGRSRA